MGRKKIDSVIEFDVGVDFSKDVLESIIELNSVSNNSKITEVYGSLQTKFLNLPSARPDFRLSKCTRTEFEKYIDYATSHEIIVNYAVNAPLSYSVEDYYSNLEKTINSLKYLEAVGVQRVIVSNPLLMEIISNYTELKIKVSTIQSVNRASSIKYYSTYNVDRICLDIYTNRNIPLLQSLAREAKKNDIELELLVNEICMYGDTPCNNMLRAACYTHSALGGNPQILFNNWPFERCQTERNKHPICWLKIPYILPQYLKYYLENTGINHFKISGRTNTHEYLLKTLRYYLQSEYQGRIQELFMLPNNRSINSNDLTADHLIKSGFFENLLNTIPCEYKCETCHYCDEYYKMLNNYIGHND